MKKLLRLVLPAFVIAFIFSSCTKNEVLSDKKDLNGEWRVAGIRSDRPYDWNGDGYSETDIFKTYSYCERDIRMNFDDNGYGQSKQGCNASWQNMYWEWSGDGSTLTIDLPGDDINLRILQFDANNLVGQDRVNINGQTFYITYTFNRY